MLDGRCPGDFLGSATPYVMWPCETPQRYEDGVTIPGLSLHSLQPLFTQFWRLRLLPWAPPHPPSMWPSPAMVRLEIPKRCWTPKQSVLRMHYRAPPLGCRWKGGPTRWIVLSGLSLCWVVKLFRLSALSTDEIPNNSVSSREHMTLSTCRLGIADSHDAWDHWHGGPLLEVNSLSEWHSSSVCLKDAAMEEGSQAELQLPALFHTLCSDDL